MRNGVGGRPQHFDVSGGDGEKRPRVRVPDPNGWSLDVLKKGDVDNKNWHEWRDSFELQVGSIWPGMDRVLNMIRDEPPDTEKVNAHNFEERVAACSIDRSYNHPADYSYAFVSNKLFMVIYSHLDKGTRKIVAKEFSSTKCGVEAYRLLNRELDPAGDDLEATLLERITCIAKWQVKGVEEEFAALREAEIRMETMQRRLGRNPGTEEHVLHTAMVRMVTGMFYSTLISPATKAYCQQKGRKGDLSCNSDFGLLKSTVEEYKKIWENSKPKKMDISNLDYSHTEWVAWQESEREQQEAWTQEEYFEYPTYPVEEPTGSPYSLDAVSKGKGKGYSGGKSGKGYGKDGGKGKGYGKGYGKDGGKGKGKTGKGWYGGKGGFGGGKGTTWVEARECFVCGETGHIARDCKKRRAANSLADGTTSSPGPLAIANGEGIGNVSHVLASFAPRPKSIQVGDRRMPVFSASSAEVPTTAPVKIGNRYSVLGKLNMMKWNGLSGCCSEVDCCMETHWKSEQKRIRRDEFYEEQEEILKQSAEFPPPTLESAVRPMPKLPKASKRLPQKQRRAARRQELERQNELRVELDADVLHDAEFNVSGSKPFKSGSQPAQAEETTSYTKPEANVNIHSVNHNSISTKCAVDLEIVDDQRRSAPDERESDVEDCGSYTRTITAIEHVLSFKSPHSVDGRDQDVHFDADTLHESDSDNESEPRHGIVDSSSDEEDDCDIVSTVSSDDEDFYNLRGKCNVPVEVEKSVDASTCANLNSAELPKCIGKRSRTRARKKKAAAERRDRRPIEASHTEEFIDELFKQAELDMARSKYELYFSLPKGTSTIEQVINSSAGIKGWLSYEHDQYLAVGRGSSATIASAGLCGLWARQAIMAANEKPQWERLILTVDSGASDTVIPPSVASNIPLSHTSRVGMEYEVANGGVLYNLGERKANILMSRDSDTLFSMSFQVVKVHKPLLAVSKLVEAGNKVFFTRDDPHILLTTGQKLPMVCNGGTYEVEVWIQNPGTPPDSAGFTRPSR